MISWIEHNRKSHEKKFTMKIRYTSFLFSSFLILILSSFTSDKSYTTELKKSNQLKAVEYGISFEKPYTHYCEVEIKVQDLDKDSLIFSMPVWTPGSYLIREFARNVENVRAINLKGDSLRVEKVNKNSWKVYTKNQNDAVFKYSVYCNELSVRTSEINSSHAFLSNAGVFMFIKGYEDAECRLSIKLPAEWSRVSTGLSKISETSYKAKNYDEFADCPIEIGNQEILDFDIKGIKHYISIYGKGNYNKDTLVKDFKKISEEEIELFGGSIPYDSFTFIINLVEKGGGGLEHLNSFAAIAERWLFSDEKKYKRFLGLISHEFFHLWNVKRIRPEALGPFDYSNENYTKSLWVAEGLTSFYDNVVLRRCGILDNKEYFEFLEKELNDVMGFDGRFRQSVEESSFDTWIKFYRKDENFHNSQISYYSKGALIAIILNLEIIKETNAEKSLDDVLIALFDDYKKDPSKGYTDIRIKELCEMICKKKLDEFWKKYVSGRDELPLDKYLAEAGLVLINKNEETKTSLDIQTHIENGKIIITEVYAGGSGYESGLNTGDEIIAINNIRMNNDLLKTVLENEEPGNRAEALINRNGFIEKISIKLLKPLPKYSIEENESITEEQNRILNKWLTGKADN